MAFVKMVPRKTNDHPGKLARILNYIMNPEKTNDSLVTSWGCSTQPDIAYKEMMLTKKIHDKENGRYYAHMVQSFPKDQDITPEMAHEMGQAFVNSLPELFTGFEIAMATHTDTGTLHNHFVINSVNAETGLKWHQTDFDLRLMKSVSKQICEERGIEIHFNDKPVKLTTKTRGEYEKIKSNTSWKKESAFAVQEAITVAIDAENFEEKLKQLGYTLSVNTNDTRYTVEDPVGNKARLSSLAKLLGNELGTEVTWTKESLDELFKENRIRFAENNEDEKMLSDFNEKAGKVTELRKKGRQFPLTNPDHVSEDTPSRERKIPAYQRRMAQAVWKAKETATSKEEFIQNMNSYGFEVRWKDKIKHVLITDANGQEHRIGTLGKRYGWGKTAFNRQFYENANGYRQLLADDIECAIHIATTRSEFIEIMNNMGYEVFWINAEPDIVVKSARGATTRLTDLDKAYTKTNIKNVLRENRLEVKSMENEKNERAYSHMKDTMEIVLPKVKNVDEFVSEMESNDLKVYWGKNHVTLETAENPSTPGGDGGDHGGVLRKTHNLNPEWNKRAMLRQFYANDREQNKRTQMHAMAKDFTISFLRFLKNRENRQTAKNDNYHHRLEGQASKEYYLKSKSGATLDWKDDRLDMDQENH